MKFFTVWKTRGFMAPWKKGVLLALKIAGGVFAGAVLMCVAAEWYIYSVSEGRIVEHSEDVPVRAPVLVLGCAPTFMGVPNGYFYNRMDTARNFGRMEKQRFSSFPAIIVHMITMNRDG